MEFYSLSPSSLLPGQNYLDPRWHQSWRCLRSLSPTISRVLDEVYSGKPQYNHSERTRSSFADRCQSGIQRLQARRINSSGDLSDALFRSADQKTRGEIRLSEMELAQQPSKIKPAPLYARRHAVQVDR